jgi:putative two-component system response regulator
MSENSKATVLVVDDEQCTRELCVEVLSRAGYAARAVSSGQKAVELVAHGTFSVVLLDIRMPGLSGIAALGMMRAVRPDVGIIMITGFGSIESSVDAMRLGAYDYILKPFRLEELTLRVRRCLEERAAQAKITALGKQVNSLLLGTIGALVKAVEAKHVYTRGHSERVSQYALEIATYYPFPSTQRKETVRRTVVLSALLHDIGKIALPDDVLDSPGELTEKQWEMMKRHPVTGTRILSGIHPLREALPGILYHHCHFNNPEAFNSYPQGRSGRRIPVLARIISVADAFDALTSTRPYRKAANKYDAAEIIGREAGRQFDPRAVRAFGEAFEVCFAVWGIGKE